MITLYLLPIYAVVFYAPLAMCMASVVLWRNAVTKRTRPRSLYLLTAFMVTAAVVGFLTAALEFGNPFNGIAVIGTMIYTLAPIGSVLYILLYLRTNNEKTSFIATSITLMTIFLSVWVVGAFLFSFVEIIPSIIGSMLIVAMLSSVVWLICYMRKLSISGRILVSGLLIVWSFVGVAGFILFETENNGIDKFTGIERRIAQNEIGETADIEVAFDKPRWRVATVEIMNTTTIQDGINAYYARIEAYSWMRIPLNTIHVRVDDDGERWVQWEETWWEKWVP